MNFLETLKTDNEKRFYGGLLGLITADALGVPVEFSSRSQREKDPVTGMRAYGCYNQPLGAWSDDSSLMLCLVEAINNDYSLNRVAENMIKYAESGYMTPEGTMFDIGIACSSAISKMAMGIDPVKCGGTDEKDNGNGSLMRILPMAFYLMDMPCENFIAAIEDVSSLTHGHARSKFACIFYCRMVCSLYKGCSPDKAYKDAIAFVKENLTGEYIKEFACYERVLSGSIEKSDISTIKSTGYVLDSLEAALFCFLTTSSYKEAVLKAVNLGGDTDTIAAICGGLAGTYYGTDGLPSDWVESLIRIDDITKMLSDFYKTITVNT